MNDDTQKRLQTAIDTSTNELVGCNVKVQSALKKNELKYSELQQKLEQTTIDYNLKDKEVEVWQKKLAEITLDNEMHLVQLDELHQEVDKSREECSQAKRIVLANNAKYESELTAYASKMEAKMAESNFEQNKYTVEQNIEAITEMQNNFDLNVQQIQSKFRTTLDENTQMWQMKYDNVHKLLEDKTAEWSLEKDNVNSCSQLKTESKRTLQGKIDEISEIRDGLKTITNERDIIQGQMLQIQQETNALKILHQLDMQSHVAEIYLMKSKINTLKELAAKNRDDGTTQLLLAISENKQLKTRLTEMTEQIEMMRKTQADVVKHIGKKCPTFDCPQVEMTEYLQRLSVLRVELESLYDEKKTFIPQVKALRDDLTYQKEKLNKCYREVGNSNYIEDKVCQNELGRCQANVTEMVKNLDVLEM
jgi:hypothetical protein